MRILDTSKFNKHPIVKDHGAVIEVNFTTALRCLKEMYGEAALENLYDIQAALDIAYEEKISPWRLRIA